MNDKSIITNDIPVKFQDNDLLNYYPFAEKIQKVIQKYELNPMPLTIGIYGKWGTGKTTLLNFIERHIELFKKQDVNSAYIKFHYNPWIYQTKEEMLLDFFDTLSRKVTYSKNDNLKKAGAFIKKYSSYLKSVKLSASGGIPKVFNAGVSIEPYEILKRIGEGMEGDEKSLDEMKAEINDALEKSKKKIIIFIDDVDRLDKDEIYTLFKLIKINADFKNLVFIVCMDQEYVAEAINSRYGQDSNAGLEYLEKIINIPLELPLIEKDDLDNFVKVKLKPILEQGFVLDEDKKELYDSIDPSLFSSPREVIRIINSFSISFYAIGEEVNLHDLFWVEYLKIKHNKAYKRVKNCASESQSNALFTNRITFNNYSFDMTDTDTSESGIRKELMEEYPKAFNIISALFPVKSGLSILSSLSSRKTDDEIDRELRICHINHFDKYFSFHTINKVSEVQFTVFKNLVYKDDFKEAIKIFIKMLSNCEERKIVFKIDQELTLLDEDFLKLELMTRFFLDEIKALKEGDYLKDSFIEILYSIARALKKNTDSKDLCIEICTKVECTEAGLFIDTFLYGNEIEYSAELETIFLEKVKKANEITPFYRGKYLIVSIMKLWNKRSPLEFKEYIYKQMDVKEEFVAILRAPVPFWKDLHWGVFDESAYKLFKDILGFDVSMIYEKIERYFPEINELSEIAGLEKAIGDSMNWNRSHANSELDNAKQFCYWYLKSIREAENNQEVLLE